MYLTLWLSAGAGSDGLQSTGGLTTCCCCLGLTGSGCSSGVVRARGHPAICQRPSLEKYVPLNHLSPLGLRWTLAN